MISNRKKYFFVDQETLDHCEDILHEGFVGAYCDDNIMPVSEIYKALAIHDPAEQDIQKHL